jgi:Fe-S-cluster-containing dehydrogenase component
MDQYLYKCQYCGKDYKPRRRHKQKFCSNSCRVNAFNFRTKKDKSIAKVSTSPTEMNEKKEENKPATKGDIQALLNGSKERYLPVSNLPIRNDGALPFYDTVTKEMIYRGQFPKVTFPSKLI